MFYACSIHISQFISLFHRFFHRIQDIEKQATASNMKIGYMASIHIPVFSTPPIVTAVAHNEQIIPRIRSGR